MQKLLYNTKKYICPGFDQYLWIMEGGGEYSPTSDTLKCRVPRSALWCRGPLWQIPNIVCWGLGDFDF